MKKLSDCVCFHFCASVFVGFLFVFSASILFAAEEREAPIERLLNEFSDPTRSAESDKTLEILFGRIKMLSTQERFSSAIHYIHQLEPARLGRTFSLSRFPEKQDKDAQIFKIRKFISAFYKGRAEYERNRGMSEESEAMQNIANDYSSKVQKTLQILGSGTENDLQCFVDDLGSSPFSNVSSNTSFVPIPTTFFVILPPFAGMGLPFVPPFTFLPTKGSTSNLALNPDWSWFLGNWHEITQTLVTGISPAGYQLVWITGPLSGNHYLSCSQEAGRWVITAGEKVVEAVSGPQYRLSGFSVASQPVETAEPLKSRGMAGFAFRPLTKDDAANVASAPFDGVMIKSVFPDTPAKKAGLEAGDLLVEYDGALISDESQFQDIVHTKYAGEKVAVAVWRHGKPIHATLTLVEPPREQASDLDIEYTSFKSANNRLRAVMVAPKAVAGKSLPGLLMVSALGSPRLRQFPGLDMNRELAFAVARQGYRVMRFELRGSGDSEGRDYRETDFRTEIDDNLAALNFLLSRSDVDPKKTYVFGHSTGGTIAAVLAGQRPVAGLIISGTIGRSYLERVFETVRLQGGLGGKSEIEIDANIKDYLALFASLLASDSLTVVMKERPALSRFVNQNQRIMDDRTSAYWNQQLNLNLAQIYLAVKVPTLILYNACDFISTRACHEWIRDVLMNAGNSQILLRIIEGADHHYAQVKSFSDSFRDYQMGTAPLNPEPIRVILEWLTQVK